jgi:cellulose synthase/poly-beta-1,6-N-acetylglucosamine synthase-like glycosyltransferase
MISRSRASWRHPGSLCRSPRSGTDRQSRELGNESATVPADGPLVSVIVPARDERRNIESCVRSILAGHYTNIEVVVADDRSSDARPTSSERSRTRMHA